MVRFSMTIRSGNAALTDNPLTETLRMLDDVRDRLLVGQESGSIYDANGNKVGSFSYAEGREVFSDEVSDTMQLWGCDEDTARAIVSMAQSLKED